MLQRCSIETPKWKFLTNDEGILLEAVSEQFIPADQDPGAKDACVVNFIDTQLMKHYKRFQETYRQGIANMQQSCTSLYGKRLEKLPEENQIEFLEKMEKNDIPTDHWNELEPSRFFSLVLSHSMQGFYGDPRHGGNCNHTSYDMIGLRVIQFYQGETEAAS